MLDTDESAAPGLTPDAFDAVRDVLAQSGRSAAATALCERLRSAGDWDGLFYAMLLEKRVALGVSPFPTGPSSELPSAVHEEYENAIRQAARTVGAELLRKGDVRRAWFYFNMISEPEPVREYLRAYQPGPEDDVQALIETALYQGADLARGFELVVRQYGICNAITTYSGVDYSKDPAAKQQAIRLLVRTLHEQLVDRLKVDLESRGVAWSDTTTVTSVVNDHSAALAESGYHLDTSHLSSVCQFSLELDSCAELKLAQELCIYGRNLSNAFQYDSDPPFENSYADYLVLLKILSGDDVESGVAHFLAKVEPAAQEGNTFPAEVCVNIYIKLNRPADALALAKKYLSGEKRQLSCPGVYELCTKAGDYGGLAESARTRGDGVNFLAGLIAAK